MQMCELASEYLKLRKLQHFTDRQALWAQLENFTRLVHKVSTCGPPPTRSPTKVAG